MNIFDQKRALVLTITFSLFLLVDLASAQTWTGPTATPPGANTPPPINVSGNLQTKSGTLGVGQLLSVGEVISSPVAGFLGQLRMVYGNFGAFFRNDGANTYLLFTNSGNQLGGWNNLRPFYANNTTGDVILGGYAGMGQTLTVKNINNGGNLGVNIANPNAKLHVSGSVRLQNLPADIANDRVVAIDTNGNLGYKPISEIAGGGGFWTANGTNIYNSNTGNVGIGVTTPAAKLQVNGNLLVTSSNNDGGIRLDVGSDDTVLRLIDAGGAEMVKLAAQGSSYFQGGFIGIGTDAPEAQFHNMGSVKLEGLQPATTASTRVITSDAGGSLSYKAIADIVGGDGKWLDTTSPQVGIYYGGNVGVNTNSLVRPLTVKGQIASVGNGNTTLNGGGLLLHDLDNTRGWFLGNRGRALNPTSANDGTNSNNFKISRCTSLNCDELVPGINVIMPDNTFLEIDYDTGDVAVGVGNLDVGGITFTTGFYANNMMIGTVSSPTIGVRLAGGTPATNKLLVSGDNLGQLTWKTLADLGASMGSNVWETGANNSINNTNTGNVGIGVVTPGTKLDVVGPIRTQGSNSGLIINGRNDGNHFQLYASSGAVRFYSNSISADVFSLGSTGAVAFPRLNLHENTTNDRVITINETTGALGWKDITALPGSGSSGATLPSGMLANQTLRWNGTAWEATSKVKIATSGEPILDVVGITRTTGLNAGAIQTQAFVLTGNGAGAGKVLTSNASGGASWQTVNADVTSLPTVARQTSNTGYGRVVTMDDDGNLNWKNSGDISALFKKSSGLNSDFYLFGGATAFGPTGAGFWSVQESDKANRVDTYYDYLTMTCPSSYPRVMSGGVRCQASQQVRASYSPFPNNLTGSWRVSCGAELAHIDEASIVCATR